MLVIGPFKFAMQMRRVVVAPHTDEWMSGDRYGEIVRVGADRLHVKMDRSGKTIRFDMRRAGVHGLIADDVTLVNPTALDKERLYQAQVAQELRGAQR